MDVLVSNSNNSFLKHRTNTSNRTNYYEKYQPKNQQQQQQQQRVELKMNQIYKEVG